jgi:putative sugar O-methyltransferase
MNRISAISGAEALQRRVEQARASAGWRAYEEARDQVLAWLAADPAAERDVSAYWREELAGFEYLLDAGPLVVERLRHHSYHVTGLRVYDYRTNKDKTRRWMETKLHALLERGRPELFVPEHPALGGFGFDIDGALINLDTLKFFESVIALDEGGVLGGLRTHETPHLAWEIGGGWGGLAYVLKTLVPGMTYAIIDLPETFLFSIPYLRTIFPDARVRTWDPDNPDALLDGWEEADFLFLPHYALEHFRPDRVDVTLNTVSFQEMTTEQVQRYVDHSHSLKGEWLYSLNRDRSLYNTELTSVREILTTRYDLDEISVLPVAYTTPLPKVARATPRKIPAHRRARIELGRLLGRGRQVVAAAVAPHNDYRHVIGHLRP